MREAISKRISRRTFDTAKLTASEQEQIDRLVRSANEKSGLSIQFIEDGSVAFHSIRKSYGLFANVHSLLLMKGDTADKDLCEKIGYYGEDIILDLTDMGLGTCWVGGTFDKDTFEASDTEEIVCVILVGKIREVTFKENLIRSTLSKKRKSVEQRLASTVDIPKWLADGIEAVRLAPSAKNSQKVTFRYDGTSLTIHVPNDYPMDMIDLGIAKKHFETEVPGTFDMGNDAAFHRKGPQ